MERLNDLLITKKLKDKLEDLLNENPTYMHQGHPVYVSAVKAARELVKTMERSMISGLK